MRAGSCLSVKGFASTHTGLKVPSVTDRISLASSLSTRAYVRLGASASTVSFAALGSSLSVRHFSRLGSGLSLFGRTANDYKGPKFVTGDGALSLAHHVHFGSSLSVRSQVRVIGAGKAGLSLFDFMMMGSSLSARSFTRLGSFLSFREKTALGNRLVTGSTSVYYYATFGSSMSTRSYVRMAST